MAKTINYTTPISSAADDYRGAWYFVPADADDDTLAKRFRFEVTAAMISDDPDVPDRRVTKTIRLQGVAQSNDGAADGSNQSNPAPWTKGSGAMRTSLADILPALYKEWRLLANDDDEA